MEKDCKLELHYIGIGPLRLSGKLALVNEFNRRSTYTVSPWFGKGFLRQAACVARFTMAAPIMEQTMTLFNPANQLMAGAQALIAAALFIELGSAGTSRFVRMPKTAFMENHEPAHVLEITRDEFDKIREELPKRTRLYSFCFNNCVQQSRRTFNGYKNRFENERSPAAPIASV